MTYPNTTTTTPPPPSWFCPTCGRVDGRTVYTVRNPGGTIRNHRVLDTFGNVTGTRHTVSRTPHALGGTR